jgi:hypothetical protein
MKVYRGVGLQLFAVLTLVLEWGKSASCLCCLTPGEIVPGVHWGGGWVGLRGNLDALEKRVIKPWSLCCPGYSQVCVQTELSHLLTETVVHFNHLNLQKERLNFYEDFVWINVNVHDRRLVL